MSVHVMSWVWKHSTTRAIARLVLLAIADSANADGGDAWPSESELASKAGVSQRHVRRVVAQLKETGELSVDKKLIKGRWRNCYRVHMTAPGQAVPPAPGHTVPGPDVPPDIYDTRPRTHGPSTPDPGVLLYKEEPPTNRPVTVPSAALAVSNPSPTARTLIAEWIDHCPKRPPENVIGQIGKHVRALIAEGIDYADVRRGLQAWQAKGLHPSTLPSVVNEIMNAGHNGAKPSTTDQRVQAALDLAAKYAGEGQ